MEVRRSARVTGLRRHPGGRGRGRLLRRSSSACEAEEADCDEFHVGRNVERRVPGPRGSDVRLLRCLMSRQSRPPLMSAPGEVHVHRKGARSAVRSADTAPDGFKATTAPRRQSYGGLASKAERRASSRCASAYGTSRRTWESTRARMHGVWVLRGRRRRTPPRRGLSESEPA